MADIHPLHVLVVDVCASTLGRLGRRLVMAIFYIVFGCARQRRIRQSCMRLTLAGMGFVVGCVGILRESLGSGFGVAGGRIIGAVLLLADTVAGTFKRSLRIFGWRITLFRVFRASMHVLRA